MKKVLFAVILGVATLGASCKKDDLAGLEKWEQEQKEKESEGEIDTSSTQVSPQPVPDINLKLVSKYASVGFQSWSLVTFYYAVELIVKEEVLLPAYNNSRRVSVDILSDIVPERHETYFAVFQENDQLEDIEGFYHIKAGETYRLIYNAYLSKISQAMYSCNIDGFFYQTSGGERRLKAFPEDMGLRVFVEAF